MPNTLGHKRSMLIINRTTKTQELHRGLYTGILVRVESEQTDRHTYRHIYRHRDRDRHSDRHTEGNTKQSGNNSPFPLSELVDPTPFDDYI